MKIGAPKEIKTQEHRAGLIPAAVRELVLQGHQVIMPDPLTWAPRDLIKVIENPGQVLDVCD